MLALLVALWIVSTHQYVYANIVNWNPGATYGRFMGFSGGCLVSGVYPSYGLYTDEYAESLKCNFHFRQRINGWGIWWPSRIEQQQFVLKIMEEQKETDSYTPELRINDADCYCLPLWMPAVGVTVVAIGLLLLSRRRSDLARPTAVSRRGPLRWLNAWCVRAGLALVSVWLINVIGTLCRTRLTQVNIAVGWKYDNLDLILACGSLLVAHQPAPVQLQFLSIDFDDLPYLARGVQIYGLELPRISTSFASSVSVGTVHRIPIWTLLVPIVAVSAVLTLVDHRIRRNTTLCATCRYDLTGNISGVCPECGLPIERAK